MEIPQELIQLHSIEALKEKDGLLDYCKRHAKVSVNYSDLTNAKLVEEVNLLTKEKAIIKKQASELDARFDDYIRRTDKQLVDALDAKAKLAEENERLKQSINRHESDYSDLQNRNIYLREKFSENKHDIEQLQSELSAAKERVKELEKNARQLCTLLAKDQILFFLSQGEKDGVMNILKTLAPKQPKSPS